MQDGTLDMQAGTLDRCQVPRDACRPLTWVRRHSPH